MVSPPFETLRVETGDGICQIRLARPALANRFDSQAHGELADALQWAGQDESTRVILLAAEGRVFSAGGDFDEIRSAAGSALVRERMANDARRVFFGLVDSPKPIVAAMQGAAAGLGATIISLCDVTVACRSARISDPHVVIGLVAGDGGIIGWAQSIGMNRARRYLLTGEALMASDAHAMGLITDLVDTPEEALPRARDLAARMAALPRLGLEGTRRSFASLGRPAVVAAFEAGLALEMESIAHPDVAAAIATLRR